MQNTPVRFLMLAATLAACAPAIRVGPLGEGSSNYPSITAVDSSTPPKSMSIKLDREAWVVVLLVAPGHSATLLYPIDSVTDNHHKAGELSLALSVPDRLTRRDTTTLRRPNTAMDTVARRQREMAFRNRDNLPMLPPDTPTYLLVITSSQTLSFSRIVEKTVGVSIPLVETEALNAVGKAVKSTLTQEPREWAGYYQQVTVIPPKK